MINFDRVYQKGQNLSFLYYSQDEAFEINQVKEKISLFAHLSVL